MYTELANLCIERDRTILDAVARMDRNRQGIILIVDGEGRLTGTVTDGDVRRAILSKVDFNLPIATLVAQKAGSAYASPITASIDADRAEMFALIKKHGIVQLPLIDADRRVKGLVTADEFATTPLPKLRAVVMAGGAGTRLRPLTDQTPKPMLPVGDRPLMEHIIDRLRDAGITRVNLSTHHISEKISEHFGDGTKFGVELSYLSEDRPLGTAGALAGLERSSETLLVMNGDILTDVDFRAMAQFHREHKADLTVAVRVHDITMPYGVVESDGVFVTKLTEKPVVKFFVNAGIYLIEPAMCAFVPPGERFDMTDLIQRLLDEKRVVANFPIREYWLDIGQHADYERAQQDIQQLSTRTGDE
ncbi:MAG: CBS domain-containing protein [Acidobacteria bacterium]|nr:MAG: CBS domain-containing protein [Acidobacteriota bacterium]